MSSEVGIFGFGRFGRRFGRRGLGLGAGAAGLVGIPAAAAAAAATLFRGGGEAY